MAGTFYDTHGFPFAIIDTIIMLDDKVITKKNSYKDGACVANFIIPYADVFKAGGFVQLFWLTGSNFEHETAVGMPIHLPQSMPAKDITQPLTEALLNTAASEGGVAGFYYKYSDAESSKAQFINKPASPRDADENHKRGIVKVDLSDSKIMLLAPILPDKIIKDQKNIIFQKDIDHGIEVTIPFYSGAAASQVISLFINKTGVKKIKLAAENNLVTGSNLPLIITHSDYNFLPGPLTFDYSVTLSDGNIVHSPESHATYESKKTPEITDGPYYVVLAGANDHHQLAKLEEQKRTLVNLDDQQRRWKNVSAGGCTHLALSEDSKAYAWGLNDWGQTGTGTRGTDVMKPTLCQFEQAGSAPRAIKEVSTAFYYSLLLDEDGYIWGAGLNEHSSMGTTLGTENGAFKKLSEKQFSFIAANTLHQEGERNWTSFAIDTAGNLYRCGLSEHGTHLPVFNNDVINVFKRVEDTILSEHKWKFIAHHKYFAAAVSTDGRVYTWGRNIRGSLGNREGIENDFGPREVLFPEMGVRIKKISLGYCHMLALDENGRLWVWGGNQKGCLGTGGNDDERYNTPHPLTVYKNDEIIDIAAGWLTSAAVTKSGRLYTWGWNVGAMLAQFPESEGARTPQLVQYNNTVGSVTFGYYSIFIMSTGKALPSL